MGQCDLALDILNRFPPSREYAVAQMLTPLATALIQTQEAKSETHSQIETTYHHALRLVHLGNLPAAMDGILAVLRQDKRYRDGEARQVLLGLFEILGEDNPITRQYRNELASILF